MGAASLSVTGASLLAAAQLGVDSVAAGVELSPRQADALAAFLNATGASLPAAAQLGADSMSGVELWRAKADALAAALNATGASSLVAALLGGDSLAASLAAGVSMPRVDGDLQTGGFR